MTYKNSIKILFSNFNIVWKSLVFFLITFLIATGLIVLFLNPVYQILNNVGYLNTIVDIYTDFITSMNLTVLLEEINHLFERFTEIMMDNMQQFWFSFIGAGLVFFLFNTIVSNLTIMPSCNSLNYYMGSMNKHGFYTSFAETFGKSFKIQLAYAFISLPIKVLNIVVLVYSLKLFNINWIVSIFAGFLIFIEMVLLLAFKYSLFAQWVPTAVITNFGVFKSLKISVRNAFRNFGRVYSSAIGIVVTIFVVNIVLGLFTFMAGTLISIPVSYLLYSVFGMVTAYECQGMKYYVDPCNVVTPRKREKSDTLLAMKYIV